MDTTRLEGKVAIITGGSSGIGAVTAVRFVEEGAKVVVAGRSGKEAELAAQYPDSMVSIKCDVVDAEQVKAMVDLCREKFGRLDIIVNNAGITGGPGRMHEYDVDEWDRVMNTNLRSAFLVMNAGIPLMLENDGGSIINVGSIASFNPAPGSAAYSPSKGGLLMLTKQAAMEYIKDNIRVNMICPGLIRTPILDGAPISHDEFANMVPMGRLGEPEDIAPFIAYLGSDESSFATGASFLIDGGHSIM